MWWRWPLAGSKRHRPSRIASSRPPPSSGTQQEKAKGVSAEALAQFTADMDQFRIQYANPLFRMPMTFAEIFPVGLLVSLISAALLRNSRFLAAKRS